ncbi:MAG: hypothetical protein IJC45_03460 [Clostridia bacterium]|nr:hypothetical protein [Clostridia bacterium]
MRNRMKKICSVLLCMLTMMNLFVGAMLTVSAVTQITAVSISGIDVPRPGQTPDYTAIGAGVYYPSLEFESSLKNGVSWSDVTNSNDRKILKPTDKFEAGHKYEISIVLEAAEGYEFATDKNFDWTVTARINGLTAKTYAFTGIDKRKNMGVRYTFTCASERIDSVAVNGINMPVAGQTKAELLSSTNAKIDANEHYSISGDINWSNVDSNGNTKIMYSNDMFESGKTYRVEIYLRAETGYHFNASNYNFWGPATINGKPAESNVIMDEDYINVFSITCDFYVQPPITTVALSNIEIPKAGNAVDLSALVNGNNPGYSIRAIQWYDMTQTPPALVYTFESGRKYQLNVHLETVGNNMFKLDNEGYLNITATINGKSATAYSGQSAVTAIVGGDYYTPIEKVAVTGIDAPVVGAKPDMTAETADEGYEVSSVLWYELDENGVAMLPALNAEYVFEEGKQYRVSVVVSAVAPYKFFCDPEDSNIQAVTATLNGKQAHVYSSYSWTKADVAYTFDKLTNAVEDRLTFKADSAFSADHDAKIAVLSLRQTAEQVSAQIANEYFDVKLNPSAEFVGTGSVITVKDQDGNTLSQYTVLVKFDVNGDGKVEPADARLALRAAVNLESFDGVKKTAADADGSAEIQPADARLILRKAVGLD